ncbi:hypothetical protein T492DRAFT_959484 [Pavlovales sp. CCMP2436]|nr:hypothetical protein T492DRAFT_959484 [Pavlovales sp. CCMP2436]
MGAGIQVSTRPYWWGGMASVLGGLLFFLACLLNLAFLSGTAFKVKNPLVAFERTKTGIDATAQAAAYKKYLALDEDLLRQLWEYRAVSANLSIVASAITTLSFFLLLATVMSLADCFDQHSGHKASKTMLVPAFLFAAALVVLDLTFNAGQTTTSAFIYDMWTVDYQTLKALEISYVMTNSREMWMKAVVWVFLGVGMSTAAYLNGRSNMLYSSWTFLSVLIALLRVSFFLLPIWMVWTGVYLLNIRDKEFTEGPGIRGVNEIPVHGPQGNGTPGGAPYRAPYRDDDAPVNTHV